MNGDRMRLDVTVNGMPNSLEKELRASPHLPKLRTLKFQDQVEDDR